MRRRPILVAWLSLAALAGCGGGADPEQFAADANAICKTRIDAIEKSATEAEQRPDSGSDIAGI